MPSPFSTVSWTPTMHPAQGCQGKNLALVPNFGTVGVTAPSCKRQTKRRCRFWPRCRRISPSRRRPHAWGLRSNYPDGPKTAVDFSGSVLCVWQSASSARLVWAFASSRSEHGSTCLFKRDLTWLPLDGGLVWWWLGRCSFRNGNALAVFRMGLVRAFFSEA